jgi:hypothetical protein
MMAKYIKKYSYKGYKIKETPEGEFDIFKPSWDENEPVFDGVANIEDAKSWIVSDIKDDEDDRMMKENAVKDYAKRFKFICEYNFGTSITEDDANPAAAGADPNAAAGGVPPAGDPNAAMPGGIPPAGDPNAAAGMDPNAPAMGGVPPAGDPNAAMPGGDPNAPAGMDPNAAQDGEFEDIDMDGGDGLQPDDNVIDVSQITSSQQQTNDEMQQLDDKFEKLLQLSDKVTQTLEKLSQSAEANQREMQSVKDDLAKRVPTEIEKLKGRVSSGDPYGQTVEDYWKQRKNGDKYDIYPDDEEKEYVLRKSDVEEINPQTVYNSFNNKLRSLVGF